MFLESIEKFKASFERLLGVNSISSLLVALQQELFKKGRTIGGVKGSHASKVAVISALKRLCRTRLTLNDSTLITDNFKTFTCTNNDSQSELIGSKESEISLYMNRDALDCIIELFKGDGVDLMPDLNINHKDNMIGDNKSDNQVIIYKYST